MAVSAIRHFSFELGRGNPCEVNKWFNTSLSIHLILPVVLILIGWPIGEYCISHILTIPPGRTTACLWVFRLSLIIAFTSMVAIPYTAMFSAKQHIAELAVWGTLQSVTTFIFAYILTKVPGDRLLFYAGYMVTISVVVQVIQVIRAHHIFSECRYNIAYWFDRHRYHQLFSFASWSLIGALAGITRSEGPAILLNLFFGPKVNASYGISSTVSTHTATLSYSMLGALSPEITASEGRGDRARMLAFAVRACKFGTLMVMFFAIPLMIEMDYVLKLWLREPPEYTAIFCRLMLAVLLVDHLSIGYLMAVNAGGKIAAFQVTLGTVSLLTIPLAWLFLKLGFDPTSVGVALLINYMLCSFGRVLWAKHLLKMSVWQWVKDIFFSCCIVAAGAVLITVSLNLFMLPSFVRLLFSTMVSTAVIGSLGWFVVLNFDERSFLIQNIGKVIRKLSCERTEAYKKQQITVGTPDENVILK